MKVKVRGKIYDCTDEPIMVLLAPFDLENIRQMGPTDSRYCAGPEHMTKEEFAAFMDDIEDDDPTYPMISEDQDR